MLVLVVSQVAVAFIVILYHVYSHHCAYWACAVVLMYKINDD